MRTMTVELSEDEANIILRALAELPYKDSYVLIAKLNMEFLKQNPPDMAEKATPEEHKE